MKPNLLKNLLLILLSLTPLLASAHDFEVDGIYYKETSSNTVAVTYPGSSYGYYSNEYTGAVVIPETVTYNSVKYNVTSIRWNAFCGCSGLTSVTIPNSVTSIESYAFYGCSGLTSFTIPNSVSSIGSFAFSGCSGLTTVNIIDIEAWCQIDFEYASANPLAYAHNLYLNGEKVKDVVIPDGVKAIKPYVFYNCTCLKSITIPNSITKIGNCAFNGCNGLKDLVIEDGETALDLGYNYDDSSGTDNGLFYDCPLEKIYLGRNLKYNTSPFSNIKSLTDISIGNSVTSIGESAFEGCSDLTSVTIPNSVTSIGESAFEGCSDLTSVTIPNSVTSIGESAFEGCSSLTSVSIGNSVETIGFDAFNSCSSLISVIIPKSVTEIGSRAFDDCTGLKELVIEDSETALNLSNNNSFWSDGCEGLFYDCPIEKLYLGRNLNYDTDESYGYSPFYNIKSLTDVTIGNLVTEINYHAFRSCSGITSVSIPNSVDYIGESAFYDCSGLKSVTIGNSVTLIGSCAFWGCTGMTSVTIGNSVTSIGTNAFKGCSSLTTVNIIDIEAWCQIDFEYASANPLAYAHNLYLNGEKVEHLVIPDGVKAIKPYVFYKCTCLTSVSIPASVTSITDYAFYGCSGLSAVNITDLEAWCQIDIFDSYYNPLYYAHNLYLNGEKVEDLVIPEGVKTIMPYVFYNCSCLTSVTIPKSVTSIEYSVFNGCTGIKELFIDDDETVLNLGYNDYYNNSTGKGLFYDCPIEKLYLGRNLKYETGSKYGYSPFYNNKGLSQVTIGNSVTTIPNKFFTNCVELTSVSIGSSVRSIGTEAFAGCLSLRSVNIPEGLTSLPEKAFFGTSLIEIVLPSTMQSIGASCFSNISTLSKVVSLNKTPPSIKSSTFDTEVEISATLFVKSGALSAYRANAIWKEFKNISEGIPDEKPIVIELGELPEVKYGDGDIDLAKYAPKEYELEYQSDDSGVIAIEGSTMRIVGAGTATITASVPAKYAHVIIAEPQRRIVVGKADLTVTVADIVVAEGQPLPDFTYIVKGLVNGDTVDDIEEMPKPVCDVTEESPAGEYTVTFTKGYDRNYDITTEDALVTVIAASGISDVETDNDHDVEVFDMRGIRVYEGRRPEAKLAKGFYIVRQGNAITKIYVE